MREINRAISVVGVDEYFITNSGLETSLGRNFILLILLTTIMYVGSDFEKVF
jgi:putative ABC transport system permease protein